MKRIIVVCIMLSLLMTSVAMAGSSNEVRPLYSYINTISASLSIVSGSAQGKGSCEPRNSIQAAVTVYLEKKVDGTWKPIATWYGSKSADLSSAGGSKQVDKGYTYRVRTVGKAYNSSGAIVETVTKYSGEKSY